jgi:DME family drug/metabolite transporter
MRGLLLVCLAASLWGTVGVATALMSTQAGTDPTVFGLVRTLLGGVCLLAAAWLLRLPRPAFRQLPFWQLAVFGIAGATFQVCLFRAFSEVGVTITVAITVCAPVLMVVAMDAAWTRTVPSLTVLMAITLGTAGVVLALPEQDHSQELSKPNLLGALMLAGASTAFAVIALITRSITQKIDPLRASGLGLAASALALAGFAALQTEAGSFDVLAMMPLQDFAILLYVGIIATGAAYLAFVLGMHVCRSAGVGLAATLVEPGIAAILAALLLHERLSPFELGGCALMLLAMLVLARVESRKPS